jgi:hypothetical protein
VAQLEVVGLNATGELRLGYLAEVQRADPLDRFIRGRTGATQRIDLGRILDLS